jgi:DNA repair exonuclease SbcCD ATPase subunit
VRGILVDGRIESNRKKQEAEEMSERDEWVKKFRQASSEISDWRSQHPRASLTDIENTVDEELAKVRAAMIQELALESAMTDIKQLPMVERPKCPQCGRPLASNGKQKRKLTTTYDQSVELERSKGYCSHCRVSYFPPR